MRGFNKRGIYRMKQFYETYKDYPFVSPLVTQISWTNNLIILSSTKLYIFRKTKIIEKCLNLWLREMILKISKERKCVT